MRIKIIPIKTFNTIQYRVKIKKHWWNKYNYIYKHEDNYNKVPYLFTSQQEIQNYLNKYYNNK